MNKNLKSALLSSVVASVLMMPMHAHSQIPVTDAALSTTTTAMMVQQIKDAALQAKDYAMQGAQFVELVNTYANAVENTVAIPAAAVAKVQSLVYRTEAIANQAAFIAGPMGP